MICVHTLGAEEIKAGREQVNRERNEELEAQREQILEVSKETQRCVKRGTVAPARGNRWRSDS